MNKHGSKASAGTPCPEGCYKCYDKPTGRWVCVRCGN